MDYYPRRRPREVDYNDGPPPVVGKRRFDKYRVTGMLLMFFGVSVFVLGVFDIGWTTSRYGNNCQGDPSNTYQYLCYGNHIYVYVGSSLWGGALLIFTAFVALGLHPDHELHRRSHKKFYFILAIDLLATPAIVVLNALEIYFGLGIYWMYSNGSMTAYDSLQVGLPITICVLAGLAFNVIVFYIIFVLCCGEQRYQRRQPDRFRHDEDSEDSYRGRQSSNDPYRHYYGRGGLGGNFRGGPGGGFRGGLGGYPKRYYYN